MMRVSFMGTVYRTSAALSIIVTYSVNCAFLGFALFGDKILVNVACLCVHSYSAGK